MTNPRLAIKYAWARQKKFVRAKTERFDLDLDTEHADDVGQVLNLRRRIERGHWEPDFLDACFQHIGANEVVAEVGTWAGPYTVLIAKHIARQGKVIGFEPDPVAFRQCVINLARNNVKNAFVHPIAVSSNTGSVCLYTNRIFGNSGSSILDSNPSLNSQKEKVEVPCTTLDGFFAAMGIQPTTIKMDIEGAEDMALSGGRTIIATKAVKVFLEVHHDYLSRRGKSANTVLQMLADVGKTVYFLENDSAYPYRLMDKVDPAKSITLPNFHILAM